MKLRYTPPPSSSGSSSTVTLDGVKVTRFNVENQYEGESFNRTGRKHTIEGTGYLTGNPFSSGSTIDTIRNLFNSPRGKLELSFDDAPTTWYVLADRSDGTAGVQDSRNGPLPTVSVTDIHGGSGSAVTLVTFSYAFFGCGATRIQRFEMNVSQSIDEAGFITLTRTGTLSISTRDGANPTGVPEPVPADPQILPTPPANGTPTTNPGNSPDLYRNLVVGRPPEGFRRVRQDFSVDSTLRNLAFTVEDRMVFRELQYPVMMGDASFTYERSLENLLGTKTFTASFEGEVTTPTALLLKVAVEASQARIDFAQDLIQSISIREPNIYTRNKIELTVTAMGQSDQQVDPNLVQDMFADPHPTGETKYMTAYPKQGVYIDKISGFVFDPCLLPDYIKTIVEVNPDAQLGTDEFTQTNLEYKTAVLEAPDGTTISTPIEFDPRDPNTDNRIKHLESETVYDHQDTGLDMLETCGGIVQFPFQTRLPVVVVKQTVKIIATQQNPPIPWENLGEDGVVLSQQIAIKNTTNDASGKLTYAIVATRSVRINVAISRNLTRITNSDSSGRAVDRRIFAPASVPSPRNPYTSNTTYNSQTDYTGSVSVTDYLINKNVGLPG